MDPPRLFPAQGIYKIISGLWGKKNKSLAQRARRLPEGLSFPIRADPSDSLNPCPELLFFKPEGTDGMGRGLDRGGLPGELEREGQVRVAAVHHHHGDPSIYVAKGGAFQLVEG